MVQHALPGTLIPVESIRDLLVEDQRPIARVPGMSLEEVAQRCAALGTRGAPVKPSAVRKWMRTGLRGVRLTGFRWGKTYRVHDEALREFIDAVQSAHRRGCRGEGADTELDRLERDVSESRQRVPSRARPS